MNDVRQTVALGEQDMQHITDLMEAHMHQHIEERKAQRKAHWKRRTVVVVVVLVGSIAAHKALEFPAFAAAAQSFDLLLTSAIEYAFTRAREWE